MPSIADYPQRLNLAPFQQTRLTELDAGLFAQLGYLNFNYLIGQPYARFADLNDSSRLNKATLTTWAIPTHQAMLQAMRQSARFARVTWTNWLETCSHRNEEDFGAITFTLAPHVYCVSFRGTTNKLVGWKEDLNMSFMPTIPAQRRALSYLTRQISRHPGTYYLTGHSKGGSLAIYAFDNLPNRLLIKSRMYTASMGQVASHSIPTTVIASPNSFPKVHSLGSVSIRQLTLKLLKVTSNFSASMTSSPGISLTILSPAANDHLDIALFSENFCAMVGGFGHQSDRHHR